MSRGANFPSVRGQRFRRLFTFRRGLVIDDDVLSFIRSTIKSVWALELLLFLRRHRERAWTAEELVRELRSSRFVVSEIMTTFSAAGLIVNESDAVYRYAPAALELDRLAERLEKTYAERPMAVVKAIVTAPND